MSNNLSSIYSSCINRYANQSSSDGTICSKDIGSNLFAAQLEKTNTTDTYINEIKNCYPNTRVTIKSMNHEDVQKYYQEWRKQPVDYSKFKHDIIVSPKVIEKMQKYPKYAEQMMKKIKKAATPEGFDNATLYEYKVIVRDDGEIETLACADFKNGKNDNIDDDSKKAEKKKLQLMYWHTGIDGQSEPQIMSKEEIKINPFIEAEYLLYMGVVNKTRSENEINDLK